MATEKKHPVLKTLHKIEKQLKSDEVHPLKKMFLVIEREQLLTQCN